MIKFLNDSVPSETPHLAFEHPSLCVGQDGLKLTAIPLSQPHKPQEDEVEITELNLAALKKKKRFIIFIYVFA